MVSGPASEEPREQIPLVFAVAPAGPSHGGLGGRAGWVRTPVRAGLNQGFTMTGVPMVAQSHSHLLSDRLRPRQPCEPTPPKFELQ